MRGKEENNSETEQELGKIADAFTEINEKVSPPYSLTPTMIEKKLEEYSPKKTLLFSSLVKIFTDNRKKATAVLAVALSVAIIAVSLPFMLHGNTKNAISKATANADISTAAVTTTGNTATTHTTTVKPKPKDDGNVMIADSYEKVYDALVKMKDKSASRTYRAIAAATQGRFINAMPEAAGATMAAGAAATQKNAALDTAAADSHGTTNTQVENVDEGDILKNDGSYLYLLSDKNNSHKLKIIKADSQGKMSLVSTTKLADGFNAEEMYINKNILVVVGSTSNNNPATGIYSDYYYAIKSDTKVFIYNIADRSKISLLYSFEQDGAYISSRLIGTKLYLVSNSPITNDLDKLTKSNVKDYVPKTGVNNRETVVPATDIAIVKDSDNLNYAVVTGLDITTNKSRNLQAVLGSGDTIYANLENLFIACGRYNYDNEKGTSSSYTSVLRFSLGDDIAYIGSCNVDGTILDKYAMDETGGYFRIATTTNNYGATFNRSNNVFVVNSSLKVCGKVQNIASGETIKSVRFMDDMVYLVTYRQTDPLFAIDLSNPESPKILGELKIPGFSYYMHPIDKNHLLGVGVNEGSGIDNVKLSIFDVTDPKNPKETCKYVINANDGYSVSSLANDPKAFMYDSSRKLLAIPVTLYPQGSTYYNSKLDVLSVFKVDLTKGFEKLFDITNTPTVKGQTSFYQMNYTNVLRGTYIGNAIYSVSERYIVSASISSKIRLGVLNLKDEVADTVYGTAEASTGSILITPDPESFKVSSSSGGSVGGTVVPQIK